VLEIIIIYTYTIPIKSVVGLHLHRNTECQATALIINY